MQAYMQAISSLPPQLMQILTKVDEYHKSICKEICFRVGQPVVLSLTSGARFVSGMGQTADRVLESDYHKIPAVRIDRAQIDEILRRFTGYSVHTHEKELHEGYFTLKGGHRAGFCGEYVEAPEGDYPYRIGKIQSINLRIARQKLHLADALAACCAKKGRLCSFLIAGPPASGKTTLLRDYIRAVSSGECCGRYYKVSVMDERGEIGAVSDGKPQFSLGAQTDCFSGYPKTLAIRMALRTMAPQLIALDELSGSAELDAVADCFYSGVRIAATVHAESTDDLKQSGLGKRLINGGCFDYLVFLDSNAPGKIKEILPLPLEKI